MESTYYLLQNKNICKRLRKEAGTKVGFPFRILYGEGESQPPTLAGQSGHWIRGNQTRWSPPTTRGWKYIQTTRVIEVGIGYIQNSLTTQELCEITKIRLLNNI